MDKNSRVKIEVEREEVVGEENYLVDDEWEEPAAVSGGSASGERVPTCKREVEETSAPTSKRQRKSKETSTSLGTVLKMEQEDSYYVTVETKSATVEVDGSHLLNRVQVNMLSHCIFCLRKTVKESGRREKPDVVSGDDDEALQAVPRANQSRSSPQLLATFNRILEYFQNKSESEQGPLGLLESNNGDMNRQSAMTFLDLPIMCRPCLEKMEGISKLLEELRAQVSTLHGIMQDCKPSGKHSQRAELFESSLRKSSLQSGVIAATINLLDQLEFIAGGPKEVTEKDTSSSADLMNDSRSPGNSSPCLQDHFSEEDVPEENSEYRKRKLRSAKTKKEFRAGTPKKLAKEEPLTDNDLMDGLIASPGKPSPCQKEEFLAHGGSKVDSLSSSSEEGDAGQDIDDEWDDGDSKKDPDYFDEQIKRLKLPTTSTAVQKKKVPKKNKMPTTKNDKSKLDSDAPKCVWPSNEKRAQAILIEKMEQAKTFSKSTYPRKGRFVCEMDGCGKIFGVPKTVWEHQVKAHNLKLFPNQCDLCGKTFSRLRSLKIHKLEGKCPPGQTCDLCKIEVPVAEMVGHVREHVGEEYVIRCPYPKCTHVYSNPQSIHRHLKDKDANICPAHRGSESTVNHLEVTEKFATCQTCGFKGTNMLALPGHILKMHENSTKNFACPIQGCPQKFTVQQSVHLHIKQHDIVPSSVNHQNCADCNTKILLTEMEGHLKNVHQAQVVIKCNGCPFLFSTRELLVQHLYTHRYGVLSCDICGDHVKFSRHADLKEHYFRVHQVGKQHICEQCGHTCLSENGLAAHIKKHQEKTELVDAPRSSFKCDVCDAAYTASHALRDHAIREHGAEPYSCRFCSATFNTSQSLKKHEREHKLGGHKEVLMCEVDCCNKTFTMRCYLKRHIATAHRGERPHVCELCGKAYALAAGLKNHINGTHLGIRSYFCDTCGESFTSGGTLQRHKMIHTGERPFSCDICGQCFRQKNGLDTHLEGHRRKGADFKPTGPMKQARKRVERT